MSIIDDLLRSSSMDLPALINRYPMLFRRWTSKPGKAPYREDIVDSNEREHCPQCDAALTSTDMTALYCTQCGIQLKYEVVKVADNLHRVIVDRRHMNIPVARNLRLVK